MTNKDDLIIIKKSTVKKKIGNILGKMLKFYTRFNIEIVLFWRRLLPESEEKISLMDVILGKKSFFIWASNAIRILLNNPITALSIVSITLYIIAGTFQGRISDILLYLTYFNILTMMFNVMGWIDKLQEK